MWDLYGINSKRKSVKLRRDSAVKEMGYEPLMALSILSFMGYSYYVWHAQCLQLVGSIWLLGKYVTSYMFASLYI